MARPSKYNWADIKKHYEAGMSQKEIVEKFDCNKGALSNKIKVDGWEVNKQASDYIANSIEVSKQKFSLNHEDMRIVEIADEIILNKTKHLAFFQNSALINQAVANRAIDYANRKYLDADTQEAKDAAAVVGLGIAKEHSHITQRNKETVLGKDKTVELNNTNAQQNIEQKVIKVEYS